MTNKFNIYFGNYGAIDSIIIPIKSTSFPGSVSSRSLTLNGFWNNFSSAIFHLNVFVLAGLELFNFSFYLGDVDVCFRAL